MSAAVMVGAFNCGIAITMGISRKKCMGGEDTDMKIGVGQRSEAVV